ncbi:hypothetical protein M1N56_05355 [Dehalococcoidia bacterium]|nr:hypothetical protein [Dehalococcoidia bacterium]
MKTALGIVLLIISVFFVFNTVNSLVGRYGPLSRTWKGAIGGALVSAVLIYFGITLII